MRIVTSRVCSAFLNGYKLKVSNTETDGQSLWLHGNKIAKKVNGEIWITSAGWETNTTKERLNGLPNVSISQKKFKWYLNGKEWDGSWINPRTGNQDEAKAEPAKKEFGLLTGIMKMGEIIHAGDQKGQNDWKARMLRAGLEGKGLIMPEDWDTLSEDEKEKRLNGVIIELSKV